MLEPLTVASYADDQSFCLTCCAKLELGILFCSYCRKANLLQLATSGLESEILELPAPSVN